MHALVVVFIMNYKQLHYDSITSQGMYQAAKYIKDEIDVKLRELHNRGYKVIITGHSLGAGVGAILAVLYWKEFHNNLHCYAFSPPGSLFTLPLVEYSKPFITTIICGNDIVPRFLNNYILYKNVMKVDMIIVASHVC